MRCDKEKLPEPNLHVCGENDTKIMVYNMRRWPKEKGLKTLKQKSKKTEEEKIKKHIAKRRTLDSGLNYSNCANDGFYISYP